MARAKRKELVLIDVPFKNHDAFNLKPFYSSIESDAMLVELKKHLEREGYEVGTVQGRDLAEADHLIFLDAVISDPVFREFRKRRKRLKGKAYLIVIDAVVVNYYEHTARALSLFDRVFTWDPARIDGKKFIEYYFPESFFAKDPFKRPYAKKKQLVMINSNKYSLFETELYTQRKKAALFFERTREGIDVYGPGWNKRPPFLPVLFHTGYRWRFVLKKLFTDWTPLIDLVRYALNARPLMAKTVKGRFHGSCVEMYSKYRFAICFENAIVPGYSTEKIFNCFNARCVPIYWGDERILKHIPASCYINMADFESYDALYTHLKTIDEKRYARYIRDINAYLKTAEAGPYSIRNFVRTIGAGLFR